MTREQLEKIKEFETQIKDSTIPCGEIEMGLEYYSSFVHESVCGVATSTDYACTT